MIKKVASTVFIALLFLNAPLAQSTDNKNVLIDEIVGVVGNNIILHSDIEGQYMQYLYSGNLKGEEARCQIIEDMLFQMLMLNQAELDSVEVTEKQVDSELDRRMRYFISQMGSKEKLEEYFKKSINEIKEDLRENITKMMKIQQIQAKITENVKVTPSQVSDFYKTIPEDSMVLIGAEYEVAQIICKPIINEEEVTLITDKLRKFKERAEKGDDFAVLANLYSEDEKTNKKGGETGLMGRGELESEVEAVAFSMRKGEISDVIKTSKGYVIIQMIERRGEYVNIRKIMIIPKASVAELSKAKIKLDKIRTQILADSITFDKAARTYSDGPEKNNGGALINQYTGNNRFEASEIDPDLFFIVDKMKVNEITYPLPMKTEDGFQAYRIIFLKERTAPHKANLKEDYSRIQNLALLFYQQQAINKWIKKKTVNTYIRVNESYKKCNFKYNWFGN